MHIDEAWQNGTLRTLTENSGKDDYGQILAPRSDRQRGWHVCRLTTQSRLRRASRKDSPRPFRAVLLKIQAKLREYGNISQRMQRFLTVLLKIQAKVREYGNISRRMQRFRAVLLKIQAKVREYGKKTAEKGRNCAVMLKKRERPTILGNYCFIKTTLP